MKQIKNGTLGVVVFFASFAVYHFIGCQIYPVDENNVLQAPDSYAFIGIAFCVLCTVVAIKINNKIYWNRLIKKYSPQADTFANVSNANQSGFSAIDYMEGHDFEYWCADLLRKNSFINVEVTRGSGDQGVDVLAEKDGIKYAIQCKCYSKDLGNTPVQEINTGKTIYNCHIGAVMTNRYFTQGAKEAAEATGVLLWDRSVIQRMYEAVN